MSYYSGSSCRGPYVVNGIRYNAFTAGQAFQFDARLTGDAGQLAVDDLALTLGLTRAEIDGVIDFYTFLHRSPRGASDVLFIANSTDQHERRIALAREHFAV